MSAAGAVLDRSGIAISTAVNGQEQPAVACAPASCLVVWQDERSGATYDVYGARVSGAGAVLDGAGIAVSTAAGDQRSPVVAADGRDYLVMWQDRRSGATYDVYGARVSGDGVVRDGDGFLVSGSPYDEQDPAVASGGPRTFLVAYDAFEVTSIVGALRVMARTVAFPDEVPAAQAQAVTVAEDAAKALTLAGSDVDGDALTYAVVAPPAHGALSGTAPSVTYTPDPNYVGSDSFTFKASDGTADSAPAVVSITVTPVQSPGANTSGGGCGCTTGRDGVPLGALVLGVFAVRRRRGTPRARGGEENHRGRPSSTPTVLAPRASRTGAFVHRLAARPGPL